MGRFDNIIIVSDIDFTFLAKDRSIPSRNLEAIKRFKEEGGRFTFGTGRSHLTLAHAFPNAAELLNAPAVVSNGCYLYDYSQNIMIGPKFLEKEYAIKVGNFILSTLPNTGLRILTANETIYSSVNKYIEKEISLSWYLNDPFYQEPKDWTGENWFKMVVRDDPDKLDFLREKMDMIFTDGKLELCKSEADFFEIQPEGCNKGRGIKYLRETYTKNGIVPKIYACGDYENDLTMLAAADVAVCPSNAHEAVKKIADMCLCSCDEGVIADLIDKL